jgi:hypothetical protein
VGDPTVASTQFRLGQFVESLSSQNITLEIVPASHPDLWPDLTSYDIIIIQKKLLRLSLVRKVRRESKCLIYDTDDAIWEPHAKKHFVLTRLRSRARLKAVLAAADLCTVPNEQLGNYLRPLTKKVALIPMALDPRSWSPPAKRECGPLRIGWTGAPPNLIYLTALEDTLVRIQHDFPEAELVIYCGQKPSPQAPNTKLFKTSTLASSLFHRISLPRVSRLSKESNMRLVVFPVLHHLSERLVRLSKTVSPDSPLTRPLNGRPPFASSSLIPIFARLSAKMPALIS